MSSFRTYFFLAKTFRNWFSLIQNLRHGGYASGGPTLDRLVMWNGARIMHPPNRGGLAPIMLEVWYQNVYRIGEFYKPAPGDVVVDVGAHVGLFTLRVLREQPRCRIIAIEPSPENFKCLRGNLHRAFPGKQVRVHRLGIGRDFGKLVMMDLPTNRSFDARTRIAAPKDTDATDAVPLSHVFKLANTEQVAFLKVDAEGGEHAAFSTADPSLFRRIQRLAMEYHDHLVPGTLALLQHRLATTHDLEVLPDPGAAHGRLFALRKDLANSPAKTAPAMVSPAPAEVGRPQSTTACSGLRAPPG